MSRLTNEHVSCHYRARMKVRGSSSGGQPKKSYSIEFYDDEDDTENISPFGTSLMLLLFSLTSQVSPLSRIGPFMGLSSGIDHGSVTLWCITSSEIV